MDSLDPLLLARLQFAANITFHILFPTISIAMALAWASGIRLYTVLFLIGLSGYFQWFGWDLPSSFQFS
jgi:cytochrome bd-type quinol oxidase subunit 1